MLTIAAYCDTWSAAPGETVAVKVGSFGARSYRAELRRIIQGDCNPEGPGEKFEVVVQDLCGQRAAREQPINPGSHIVVPDRGRVLADLGAFTLAVPIEPTRFPPAGATVVRLSDAALTLALDETGRATLKAGGAKLTLPAPLALRTWTVLTASYDPQLERLHLAALDRVGVILGEAEGPLHHWSANAATTLLIGAELPGLRGFDGKIDSPALFSTALAPIQAFARISHPAELGRGADIVAFWDFSRAISTRRIEDASPHHLDGEVRQCPARAMTGWRWAGESGNWTTRPDLYSAIHFHSDDMTDAQWATDFSISLPEDLRSGIYSVHLVPDEDDGAAFDCVFVVRPPRHRPSGNAVCMLLPTASYLAYANHRLGLDVAGTEIGMGRLVEIDHHHAFLQEHPELGYSFYEVHDDGSGVFYSSRNRPVVDFQPGVKGFLGGLGSNVWQLAADTHITGWLDAGGMEFDVITDEDLHRDGLALLRQYRVVITGSHPEYHSAAMLDAIEGFLSRGGRLMYLGGNGFYWRISFSDCEPGVIECRRSEAGIRPWEPGIGQFHHAFTGEYGGLWRRNGRSSGALVGLVMSSQGFDVSEPYQLSAAVDDARVAFLFKGLEVTPGRAFGAFGLAGGGAAGLEIDRAEFGLGTPAHALVLGTTVRHTDIYLMTPEDLLDPTPDMSGTQSDMVRADMVFFETSGGGAVFSVGSIAWAAAMAWNGYDNEVARLSLNALRRFIDPIPFLAPDKKT